MSATDRGLACLDDSIVEVGCSDVNADDCDDGVVGVYLIECVGDNAGDHHILINIKTEP